SCPRPTHEDRCLRCGSDPRGHFRTADSDLAVARVTAYSIAATIGDGVTSSDSSALSVGSCVGPLRSGISLMKTARIATTTANGIAHTNTCESAEAMPCSSASLVGGGSL